MKEEKEKGTIKNKLHIVKAVVVPNPNITKIKKRKKNNKKYKRYYDNDDEDDFDDDIDSSASESNKESNNFDDNDDDDTNNANYEKTPIKQIRNNKKKGISNYLNK